MVHGTSGVLYNAPYIIMRKQLNFTKKAGQLLPETFYARIYMGDAVRVQDSQPADQCEMNHNMPGSIIYIQGNTE